MPARTFFQTLPRLPRTRELLPLTGLSLGLVLTTLWIGFLGYLLISAFELAF
jgi:hypothetical protein